MLNHIIFVLTGSGSSYMQTITEDILCIKERLQDMDVTVSYTFNEIEKTEKSDTLYIADNSEILKKLLSGGCYAIALRHEYNCQEDLSRALYAIEDIREMEYDSFLKAYERLAGLPWHIVDTDRLTIRETTVADVDEFYRIYQEPSITDYTENLYQDVEEERAYVRDYIEKVYGFYGYGIWTVLLRETGEVIGRAGINWREGYQHPELGFVIAKEHQRQGYAEEACLAILEFAGRELLFTFIYALVETENVGSLELCYKLGFEYQETVSLREKEHALLIKKV